MLNVSSSSFNGSSIHENRKAASHRSLSRVRAFLKAPGVTLSSTNSAETLFKEIMFERKVAAKIKAFNGDNYLRISVNCYNDFGDIDKLVEQIKDIFKS